MAMGKLEKSLQILVGDRESIQHSAMIGMASAAILAIIFLVFVFIFPFDHEYVSLLSGLWYFVFLASVFVVVIIGRSVGWLFTRPIASLLLELWPNAEHTSCVWVVSNTVVWAFIVPLTTLPFWWRYGALDKRVLGVAVCGAIISGAAGGKLGMYFSTNWTPRRKDRRQEPVAIGATVSGSVLSLLLQAPSFCTIIRGVDYLRLSEWFWRIGGNIVVVSFGGMILYSLLIRPIVSAVKALDVFQRRPMLAWVAVSAVVWTVVVTAFGIRLGTRNLFLGSIGGMVAAMISGACGGWATGQVVQYWSEAA